VKHERLRERVARIRAARAQARHNSIVEADTHAEALAEIEHRAAAGEIAPGGALLIVPRTCDDLPEWEARRASGHYKPETDPPAET